MRGRHAAGKGQGGSARLERSQGLLQTLPRGIATTRIIEFAPFACPVLDKRRSQVQRRNYRTGLRVTPVADMNRPGAEFVTVRHLSFVINVNRKVQLPRKPPQGIEGTGDNRDNGETFSLLPLSPLFAKDPTMHPIHQAQLLSYMKLLDIPLRLIINFNVLKLTGGVLRLILLGANSQ